LKKSRFNLKETWWSTGPIKNGTVKYQIPSKSKYLHVDDLQMESSTGRPLEEVEQAVLYRAVGAAFACAGALCTVIGCCRHVYRRLRGYVPAAAVTAGAVAAGVAVVGQLTSVAVDGPPAQRGDVPSRACDVQPGPSPGACGAVVAEEQRIPDQPGMYPALPPAIAPTLAGTPPFARRNGPWRNIFEEVQAWQEDVCAYAASLGVGPEEEMEEGGEQEERQGEVERQREDEDGAGDSGSGGEEYASAAEDEEPSNGKKRARGGDESPVRPAPSIRSGLCSGDAVVAAGRSSVLSRVAETRRAAMAAGRERASRQRGGRDGRLRIPALSSSTTSGGSPVLSRNRTVVSGEFVPRFKSIGKLTSDLKRGTKLTTNIHKEVGDCVQNSYSIIDCLKTINEFVTILS